MSGGMLLRSSLSLTLVTTAIAMPYAVGEGNCVYPDYMYIDSVGNQKGITV